MSHNLAHGPESSSTNHLPLLTCRRSASSDSQLCSKLWSNAQAWPPALHHCELIDSVIISSYNSVSHNILLHSQYRLSPIIHRYGSIQVPQTYVEPDAALKPLKEEGAALWVLPDVLLKHTDAMCVHPWPWRPQNGSSGQKNYSFLFLLKTRNCVFNALSGIMR